MFKKLTIPLYGAELITYQVKKFDELNEEFNISASDDLDGFCFRNPKVSNFPSYIQVFKSDATTIPLICHESLHVVNMLFHDYNITHDTNNDEPAAYLLSWIVEELIEYLYVKLKNPHP